MPNERESITRKFSIGSHEGYITAGKYDDGSVGEIFLTDIGKEGSTMRGMMNAFATAISIGLQYGVPLETFVEKFSYMRFDPEGSPATRRSRSRSRCPTTSCAGSQAGSSRPRHARGPRDHDRRGAGPEGGPAVAVPFRGEQRRRQRAWGNGGNAAKAARRRPTSTSAASARSGRRR